MREVDLLATCWTTSGATRPLTDHEESPEAITDRIAAAAKAGFTGFGLLHADLVVVRNTMGYPELRSALAESGMKHLELEMLVDWWTASKEREHSDLVRHDLLEAAAALEARHIKVGGDYVRFDWSLSEIVPEFRMLCQQAWDVGARIAYEPMPFANIRTPLEALALIEETDHAAAGMIIDSWHVARGNVDWSSLSTIPAGAITSIEMNDADDRVVGTMLEDTINNRRLCGEGTFDLPAFITAIMATGYDGPWGVEILSHEFRALPMQLAVQAAFDSARAQFDRAFAKDANRGSISSS